MLLEEGSSLLFGLSTNLTDHDDTLSVGVVEEDFQAVNEVGSVKGISTNTNTQGLTKARLKKNKTKRRLQDLSVDC